MPTLKVTDTQIKVLEKALDLYNRVLIGQLEEPLKCLEEHYYGKFQNIDIWELKNKYINPLKQELGWSANGSWGIGNGNCHPNVGISYDMQKSLQKYIAVKEEHPQYSVWRDGNLLKLSKEPNIVIDGGGENP